MKKVALRVAVGALVATVFTPQAFAKSVGHYSVHVTVENAVGGSMNDWMTYLSGWSCFSSTEASFSEILRDNHGVQKPIERKANANWNFFSDSNVSMNFDRDMTAPDPRVGIEVSENCSKTVHHYSTVYDKVCDAHDDNGNCTSSHSSPRQVDNPEYKSAIMSWDCSMSVASMNEQGQSEHQECKPDQNTFTTFDFESVFLASMKEKKFSADLALNSKEEQFAQNFCSAGDKDRVIIHLTQGVGGNALQHDFDLHFNIEGHEFDIENKDGILNDDVALCGAGDQISISAIGTAKNMIFPNSHYTSDQTQAAGSVTLTRRSASNWGEIDLKRHAFLGNWTVNPDNKIMTVVDEAN